jgi:hypothetical protein
MSTTMTVPVTIAPEACEFIERVGQREQFDMMLERAKRFGPTSTTRMKIRSPPPGRRRPRRFSRRYASPEPCWIGSHQGETLN